jgi:DNA-binding transcriptional ArsR family regulator
VTDTAERFFPDRGQRGGVSGERGDDSGRDHEWAATNVFELLGDEEVREILVLTSEGPQSAEELAERGSASQPTVYRRIEALQEYDLLDESVEIDADGNHYRTYESRLKEICFTVTDGAFTVDIQFRRDPLA